MIGRVIAVHCVVAVLAACGETSDERAQRREREQSQAHYKRFASQSCPSRSRSGPAGYSDTLRTPKGVPFTVVTPRNYQSSRAHPLLIVFAPAGIDRFEVERVTGFTQPATRTGFVVAYANHPPLGPESTLDLDQIRELVVASWCIDTARVFYAGHSDGGTVSHALAAMPATRGHSAGIAPSAAGMTDNDLASYGCPAPLAVMVTHSTGDQLFPGWGQRTARWWGACNECDSQRALSSVNGCVKYAGCDPRGPTMYCEHQGTHAKWPGRADAIVEFFQSIP